MVEKPFFINQPLQPVKPVQEQRQSERRIAGDEPSFQKILQGELQQDKEIKFSRHATERLYARRIELGEEQLSRLKDAVDKAEAKGCRESLVLLDDLALVVSVKNKTVITAVDGENRKENVFTNIDSAVIN